MDLINSALNITLHKASLLSQPADDCVCVCACACSVYICFCPTRLSDVSYKLLSVIQASAALKLCDAAVARLEMKPARGCELQATGMCVCVGGTMSLKINCFYHRAS